VTVPSGQEPEADEPGLVVIGASAGGVETLRRVVGGLPADLSAAVCVVLHLAPGSPSALAGILNRVGPLPCRAAVDGESLRAGEVIVAPPDRHLVVVDGRVQVKVGPRENGHRPSVDVLFRSAASAKDGRVVGVVLSGTRDDGTAGLAVIKANGGAAIVQDPDDALYAGMPTSALAHVSVDAVATSDEIPGVIVRMVSEERRQLVKASHNPGHSRLGGEPVISICPECGGVLSEYHDAGLTQWRCGVGHRYSPASLADAQAEGVEATLWAAVRALEDRHALLARMAAQLVERDLVRSARSLERRAREAGEQAQAVRETVSRAAKTTLRSLADDGEIDPHETEEALDADRG
jgi:two-component system, chemotaxis family, protein-glutamate methylesterase/glutaminase